MRKPDVDLLSDILSRYLQDAARTPLEQRNNAINPLAHRGRKASTFAEAARQVYAEQIEPTARSAKHKVQWISTLEKSAFPLIGDRPVDQIEQSEILKVLQPIWLTTPETARRVRQRLRTVFAWARTAGHREASSPVEDIEKGLPRHKAKVVHFAALPWREVPAFVADLSALEAISVRALRFAILTCARSGEVRGARWSEIDMDADVWAIPAARMQMKREHRVPATGEAVALLRSLPRMQDDDHVIPAARGGALSDMAFSAVMRRILEVEVAAGRKGYVTPRSGRAAVPLAHAVGSETERSYRRGDMIERRRGMMAAWARFLRGDAGAMVVAREAGA